MTAFNFFSFLEDNASVYPDDIAVYDHSISYTFRALLNKANQIHQLISEIPVGEGVILFLPNTPEFIAGLFGIIKRNLVALPVDYHQQREALQAIMEESKINYVISLKDEKFDFLTCKKYNKNIGLFTGGCAPQNIGKIYPDAAFIRFTSGTTGKSKGVVISHEAVKARTAFAQSGLDFQAGQKILWLLPMAFHFVVSICLYIRYRIPIVIQESFLPEEILQTLKEEEISYVYASPVHVKTLGNIKKSTALPHLKMFISTTAGLDHSAAQKFYQVYNLPVTQAFGIIEVGLPLINKIDAESHPEAVGCATEGNDVRLFDEDMNFSDKNEGLLGIRKNKGMFSGYLSPLKKIDEILSKDFFITGDIAYRDEHGSFYIKGRAKNVILVAGNKVFPAEIEQVINQINEIDESYVFGQKHPIFGQTIAVHFVSQNQNVDLKKLRHDVQSQLLRHQWPHQYTQVDVIQKTDTGKIKRF